MAATTSAIALSSSHFTYRSNNVAQNRLSRYACLFTSNRTSNHRAVVTGANRGIGYGLVEALAKLPDTVVFAGTRNIAATSLKELAARYPNLHAVKVTSASPDDNKAAIAEIKKIAGQLDVVIANAGARCFISI